MLKFFVSETKKKVRYDFSYRISSFKTPVSIKPPMLFSAEVAPPSNKPPPRISPFFIEYVVGRSVVFENPFFIALRRLLRRNF